MRPSKVLVSVVVACITATLIISTAEAGGYDKGSATGACTISPSSVDTNQTFTVSASGLPTDGSQVWVIVLSSTYKVPTRNFQIYPNSDGTYSFSYSEPYYGKYTFEFDQLTSSTNGWKTATRIADCSVRVS
jgi:hypothetical protein